MNLIDTYNKLKIIYETELKKQMQRQTNQYKKALEDLREFLDRIGFKMPKPLFPIIPKFRGR